MTKYEIARWLTPGLAVMRLAFTTFGGSAHGGVTIEVQDMDTGVWREVEKVGTANGVPEAKGEKVGEEHINQFTGETVK